MFVRMGILIAGGQSQAPAALPGCLSRSFHGGLLVALVLSAIEDSAKGDLELSNPRRALQTIKFAMLFAVVLLGSKAATTWLGARGATAAAALAGMADVDAITLFHCAARAWVASAARCVC